MKFFSKDYTTTSTSIVERHGSGHPVPTHILILTNLGDYHVEYLHSMTYTTTLHFGVDDGQTAVIGTAVINTRRAPGPIALARASCHGVKVPGSSTGPQCTLLHALPLFSLSSFHTISPSPAFTSAWRSDSSTPASARRIA